MIGQVTRRLLGHDEPHEFALVVGLFVLYTILDATSRAVASINVERLDDQSLLVGAVLSQPLAFFVLAVAATLTAWRWRERIWAPWARLDQGRWLQVFAGILIALVAWRAALYEFNYVLGQTHLTDRLLAVALAVGCLARPVFLLPFAIEARIIASQFEAPFGSIAAQNIGELLIIALLAIAAVHLLFVATGRNQSAPVLLLLGAAVATHFYIPAKSKLSLDWLNTTDFPNLPLNSYTAGWRGQGDGSWAGWFADTMRSMGKPLLIGALAFESASVIAVLHHRLLRLWLPFAVVFHITVFAMTGFWFLSWILVEIGLIVLLSHPRLHDWRNQNATPARALVAVTAVVIVGSTIFHPPALSWFDAPVSYGYRIEATGVSGTRYNVPISAFAPMEQDLAFLNVRLRDRNPASGAYGAVVAKTQLQRLDEVSSFADLTLIERAAEDDQRETGQVFMRRWMDNVNHRGSAAWSKFAPPDYFWTGSPSPSFDFDEQINRVDVHMLISIHHDGEPEFHQELVLTMAVDANGDAQVTFPESPTNDQ